jgi:hypothetical protein
MYSDKEGKYSLMRTHYLEIKYPKSIWYNILFFIVIYLSINENQLIL